MGKQKNKSQAGSDAKSGRIIDVNKKARHNYEILDTVEAGIVLTGSEVKSVREGGISLRDSYVRLQNGECFLVGCHIAPYKFSRLSDQDPYRDRKLLLHRREIARLHVQVQQKGLTLVPLKAYFNPGGRCKIEIGLARGKKLHDKREDMKAKTAKRDIERAMSHKNR